MKTLLIAAVVLLAGCGEPCPAEVPAPLDYNDAANWLCLPGKTGDACQTDLTATEIRADGSKVNTPHVVAPSPKIDCFYVYPTVDLSLIAGNHTDFKDLKSMTDVAVNQAARFSEVCRVHAPLYRQITIGTYLQPLATKNRCLESAFSDVRAAFNNYLTRLSGGRDFMLLGHSQGGQMVDLLLQRLFVDDPTLRSRLVVAMPIGTQVGSQQLVPKGQETATKQNIPLCSSPTQRGCTIAYRSIFAGGTPSSPVEPGLSSACVNPANPGSTAAAPLTRTFFPRVGIGGLATQPVTTPSALFRNFYSARCVTAGAGQELEISEMKQPNDQRSPFQVKAGTDLHVADVNLALGDLIDRVRERQ